MITFLILAAEGTSKQTNRPEAKRKVRWIARSVNRRDCITGKFCSLLLHFSFQSLSEGGERRKIHLSLHKEKAGMAGEEWGHFSWAGASQCTCAQVHFLRVTNVGMVLSSNINGKPQLYSIYKKEHTCENQQSCCQCLEDLIVLRLINLADR